MKTAVDWLIEQLKPTEIGSIEWYKAIEQANEMFREQIKEAHLKALCQNCFYGVNESHKKIAEQYYNETYGK